MSGTVLLVENQKEAADELERAFERSGIAVKRVASGEEAEELARTLRPAAILAAIELPRMNGYSLCQRLRQIEETRDAPIFLMGSTDVRLDLVQGEPWRASAYFRKPVDIQKVVQEVVRVVDEDPFDDLEVDLDDVMELLDDGPSEGSRPSARDQKTLSGDDPFAAVSRDADLLDGLFQAGGSGTDGLSILTDLGHLDRQLKARVPNPTSAKPTQERSTVQLAGAVTSELKQQLKDTQDVPILEDDDLEQILEEPSPYTISNDIPLDVPASEAAGGASAQVTAVNTVDDLRAAQASARPAKTLVDRAPDARMELLQDELAQLRVALQQAQAERDAEAAAARSASEEVERLKAARDEGSQALQEVWQKVEEHQRNESSLRKELESLSAQQGGEEAAAITALQEELREAREAAASAREAVTQAEQTHQEERAGLTAEIEALREGLREARVATEGAAEEADQVTTLREECATLVARGQELEQAREKLEAELASLRSERDKTLEESTTHQNEATRLERELSVVQERALSLESRIEDLQKQLAEATRSSAGPSAREVLALRESLNAKDRELLGLRDEALRKEHAVLEAQELLAQAEAAKLSREEEHAGELKEALASLETARSEAEAAASALASLREEEARLREDLDTQREAVAAAERAAEDASNSRAQLQRELDASSAERKSLVEQVEGLEDEVRSVAGRLQEAEEGKRAAEQTLQEMQASGDARLRETQEALEAARMEAKAAAETAVRDLAHLTEERDQARARLDDQSAEVKALQERAEALEARIEAATKEHAARADEWAKQASEATERQEQLAELVRESASVAAGWQKWAREMEGRVAHLRQVVDAVAAAMGGAGTDAPMELEPPTSDADGVLRALASLLEDAEGEVVHLADAMGLDN